MPDVQKQRAWLLGDDIFSCLSLSNFHVMRALEHTKMERKWLNHRVMTARHSPSFGGCMDYKFLKEGVLLAL